MMTQRTNILALLTACVLALGTAARAQETVRIALPHSASVNDETTDQIIIFGQETETRSFLDSCLRSNGFDGDNHPMQRVVAVDRTSHPVVARFDEAYLEFSVDPGTRLVNLTQVASNCVVDGVDYDIFEAVIASSQDGDALVVMAPSDSLTENHEAVIKTGADASGISDSVCVTKGEKPTKTVLIADIDLYAGDRLTAFVEVDHDPDTGETWYACWLDY